VKRGEEKTKKTKKTKGFKRNKLQERKKKNMRCNFELIKRALPQPTKC
jgi:hypothetical protein